MLVCLILQGRVQRVGCRYYCSQVARKMKLKGTVSNLSDGTVQVIIECNDESEALTFKNNLKNNRFGFNFFGTITGIRLEKTSSQSLRLQHADYTF